MKSSDHFVNQPVNSASNVFGRYILVRYEDLVDNPMPTLSNLYNHLQLPFTQEVEEYLFKMTHATEK